VGDPTETALVAAASKFGFRKRDLERRLPRIGELAFDSERKRMTTIHALPDGGVAIVDAIRGAAHVAGSTRPVTVAFCKGAVDRLIDVCTRVWADDAMPVLDGAWRERIVAAHDRLAAEGSRVLGLAFRPLGESPSTSEAERDMVFVGIVGIVDPPRTDVADAVATCVAAGIRPVMITGDHPLTARHIAGRLGIASEVVVTGAELDRMPAGELPVVVERASLFARVSPSHKLRIVEALQQRGQVVAMTGDGVNDAPALKRADIGVAMGITGTDVAKEAADAVLLDDHFGTIVSAVEEGRIIYDNIRKFVKYLLTTNSAELWLMLVAPLLGMPLPLLPLQILWINLVTDGPTALTLGVEPAERDVMRRPPRSPSASLFDEGLGRHVLVIGLLMGALTIAIGYAYWRAGHPGWQTVVFTSLAFAQMAHVVAIRSSRDSVFWIGLFSNRPLAWAVAMTIGLQLVLVYVDGAREIFSTHALSAWDLLACTAVGAVVFVAVETEKYLGRRWR
jgi:Ca2+-transporting ATPase